MKRFDPRIRLGPLPYQAPGGIWAVVIEVDSTRLFEVLSLTSIHAKSGKATALRGAIRATAKRVAR